MSSLLKPGLTPAEYLVLERASEGRHEYLDGEMYAMSGASADHVRTVGSSRRADATDATHNPPPP